MQIYNCIPTRFLLQYRTYGRVCAMRPDGKEEKSFYEGVNNEKNNSYHDFVISR